MGVEVHSNPTIPWFCDFMSTEPETFCSKKRNAAVSFKKTGKEEKQQDDYRGFPLLALGLLPAGTAAC